MANPPPEANIVARSALAALHHDRPILTYGGWTGTSENRLSAAMCSNIDLSSQAPPEIEGHADATWSQTPDLYGIGGSREILATRVATGCYKCTGSYR